MHLSLKRILIFITFVFSFFVANIAFAAPIDAVNKYSQFLDTDNGEINWLPTNGTPVDIDEGAITGEIWGTDVGWINLAPTNGGVTLTCAGDTGTFGGTAWGQNTGWINFEPTNGGVTLDATGQFDGDAWSENYGWINFTCPGADTCVSTSFVCEEEDVTPPGGGGSGGNKVAQCTLEAVPATILPGASSSLVWDSNIDADADLTISTITPSVGNVSTVDGSVIVSPTVTTTYTASFKGKKTAGTGTCSATVTVAPGEGGGGNDSIISFQQNTYSEGEAAGQAVIQVVRTGDLTNATSVTVTTADWSAESGLDYLPVSQTISWAAGEGGPKNISIDILEDTVIELDETFSAQLSNPSNSIIGTPSQATITIIDNDIDPNDPGYIRFVENAYQTLEQSGNATLAVARFGGSLGAASVSIVNQAGTATADNDYVSIVATISWADGETGPKTFQVPILDDTLEEDDEDFQMLIDGIVGATLVSPTSATVTIIDNDGPVPEAGCLDPNDQNFNPLATINDPSQCSGASDTVYGCTDEDAQNYNPAAEIDNGSCSYRIPGTIGGFLPEGGRKTLQIIALIGLIGSLPAVGFRLGNLLLAFLGFHKKNRPWGTVYNAKTKQPLDPAYVTLYNEAGQEIASAITDPDGRYGFVVEPGRYRVIAQKTHFSFPSQLMAGKHKDDLYDDLYFGEYFEIKEKGQVIAKNIPMDPVAQDWNEVEKAAMGERIFKFFSKYDRVLLRIINTLFWVGFVFSVVVVILYPVLWNIIVVALYLLMVLLILLGAAPVRSGVVTDRSGTPLQFAIVRIFNAHLNKEIAHKVTNEYGQYYALVQKGEYYLTIEQKHPDGSYVHMHTTPVVKSRRGYINVDVQTGR